MTTDEDHETVRRATANLAALNRVKALAGKWEDEAARLTSLAALKDDPADRADYDQKD